MHPNVVIDSDMGRGGKTEKRNLKITIPNMTVVPESAFVNFITLAESVALAPMADFWTSLDVFSISEIDVFNLTFVSLFDLLVLWTSSYIKSQSPGN